MIQTLIELQRLKNLDRTGWPLRGLPPGTESVAAHSFGVAVAAMLLADEIAAAGVPVSAEKVLRMALMHDWAEARLGDMPKTAAAYFPAEARRHAEREAFDGIVADCESRVRDECAAVHAEYEDRAGIEAQIVKAADVIDLLIQVLSFERAGVRGLDEFWENSVDVVSGIPGPAAGVVAKHIAGIRGERDRILRS